jgi:orotate phosphoribosyltransferase
MALVYEKARLKELIIQNALFVSLEPITLSSGLQTHHYYDLKKVLSDAEGLRLVAVLMIEEMTKLGDAKSVGGLETGAIPIAIAISRESLGSENMHSFFVRKQQKEHGLGNLIEGDPVEPVVIVDDVITKGESVLKAINAMKAIRKSMLGVVSIIDRGGGKENLQANWKIKHVSLFEDKDFEEVVKEKLSKLQV